MTKGEVDLMNDKIDTVYKRMKEVESKLKMIECTHHPKNIEYIINTQPITNKFYTKQCKLCGKILCRLTHSAYLVDKKHFLEKELEEVSEEISLRKGEITDDQAKD